MRNLCPAWRAGCFHKDSVVRQEQQKKQEQQQQQQQQQQRQRRQRQQQQRRRQQIQRIQRQRQQRQLPVLLVLLLLKWLIPMVIVSPLRIRLWDPFQMAFLRLINGGDTKHLLSVLG